MARELLLAQSSDWAFIMTTGTTVPYALRRTRDHINRFTGLYTMLLGDALDEGALHQIAWRDSIFPELDYRVYA
jgi:1,4-alpha-glucan branching enzyme